MKSFRLSVLFALTFTFSGGAFAVEPSTEGLDLGIAVGALFSTKTKVKTKNYTYDVIAADLFEPACNSVQLIVHLADDAIEGSGTVTYNLGLQTSGLVSAKAMGKKVVLKVRVNNVEDCSKSSVMTYTLEYTGNASKLDLKKN